MSRNAAFKSNFGAGVVSPLLQWRLDYQRTQTGVRAVNGFLPLREGGMMRAPGTVFWDYTLINEETGNDRQVRLIPFEFNAADAVVLEFYSLRMRVRRYGALVMDGPVPFELALPYNLAAISRLTWVQSADVIYLADGVLPIHKLSRFALDNWTIEALQIDSGPFRVANTEKTKKITASAATGTVTLTSDFDIFTAGHVGSLLRLEPESWTEVPIFNASDSVSSTFNRMRNDGKVYALLTGSDSGDLAPVHDEGDEQTTSAPIRRWRYISDSRGVVRITAVAGPQEATAIVLRRIPEPARTLSEYTPAPTYRWAEGAWSDLYGYPAILALYDQRMFAARSKAEPRSVWASATGGGYLDFDEAGSPDDAFSLVVDGEGSQNPIQWMIAGRRALHIGALAEEYSLRSISDNAAVAVNNVRIGRDSGIGSIPAPPIAPFGDPFFISRDGRRLFEIAYVLEQDANIARELSLPARHLGSRRFRQVVHQGAPLSLTWVRRENGDLLALSYDRGEDAQGWAPLSLAGGVVEDMAVTRAGSDDAALLVLVVRRQLGGVTRRCIEVLSVAPHWDFMPPSDVPATHLFCAAVFTPGTPSADFAAPHLAGRTVQVWADNQDLGAFDLPGTGSFTLPFAASRCEVGLFDATHFMDTFDLGDGAEGSVPGARRRIENVPAIQVFATQQGEIATVARAIGKPDRVSKAVPLLIEQVAGNGMLPVTGAVKPVLAGGFEPETSLRITPVSGASLTVLAITAILQKAAV